MRTKLIKFINNLNETILAVVFSFIIILSVIVVESIQIKPIEKVSVLGLNNSETFFTHSIDNSQDDYKVTFTENDYQLSFNFNINLNGNQSVDIPLGKINTKTIKQGNVFRSIVNLPEIYKNDINILLMIGAKPYGLLLNGVFYQNDFNSSEDNNSDISIKIIARKNIYYSIQGNFIIYK